MTFNYDALVNFDKVVIHYAGSGDEGFIEDIDLEPELPEGLELSRELEDEIEETAYAVLGEHFGGWEINAGSDGTITIDVKARKATIHHGWTVESKRWEDVEIPDPSQDPEKKGATR